MPTSKIDAAKAEAFAGQMIGHLNGAALTMMISIGHQTGLFDTMAALPGATSLEIAKAAKLNERYVREWLAGMATGKIVTYSPKTGKYKLPPEHAASLTRSAGPNNISAMAQFTPIMGLVEGQVIDSFRNGGGVPYSEYPRFQKLMAEESAQVFDATLTGKTLPLVPGLVKRLQAGIDVADIGCGSGHAINLMAKAFPKSRFAGFDFSEEGIATGKAEAKKMGLRNATFVARDVADVNMPADFDLITAFDAIHDQAQPRKVLKNIARALRPDGTFLMVDVAGSSKVEENIDHPLAPFLYTASVMHCMTVSLALNGEGLGTMWGEQKAKELLAEAGFRRVSVKRVEGDILNNYYIARKS